MKQPDQSAVLIDGTVSEAPSGNAISLTSEEILNSIKHGRPFKYFLRFKHSSLLTFHNDLVRRPLAKALVLRFLSRGEACFMDQTGEKRIISLWYLFTLAIEYLRDLFVAILTRFSLYGDLKDLAAGAQVESRIPPANLTQAPAYIYSDLIFNLPSGGSVTHVAGVLNNLSAYTESPIFFSTLHNSIVATQIEHHRIIPSLLWNFPTVQQLHFSKFMFAHICSILNKRQPSFVYQRYGLNNYTGVKLSRFYNVPLVLEFNGSDLWIRHHWGGGVGRLENISRKIEHLNLKAATLIVAVSTPLRDSLLKQGIDENRILVNPNGVDSDVYSPYVDGSIVRKKYNLEQRIVIGFIGTFGRWHGAEVLAAAIGIILEKYPEYRQRIRLMMIGDGVMMPVVKAEICKSRIGAITTLTGLIPQAEGPKHLAACDILVSPHVPNPDGSEFFGSPTKLFEYMAMAKGIVASDLAQIGEILKHEQTALLVKPADPHALAAGIKKLIDSSELAQRLGYSARCKVLESYTWKEHTRKIIEKLFELISINKE